MTVTVTVASVPTPAAESVTVVDSLRVSSSCWAVTVTDCAVAQLTVVNVSAALSTLAAPVSALATATVVSDAGRLSSTTVKVRALPPPVVASVRPRESGVAVASSDGVTATVGETMVLGSAWAAAATVTPRVRLVSKSVSL